MAVSNACRRLQMDLQKMTKSDNDQLQAAPADDDIMKWEAIIFGPPDTIWEGGIFQLTIDFSEEYPNKPPLVKFVTKMFHPNIYNDGRICLDILQSNWSPIYDV